MRKLTVFQLVTFALLIIDCILAVTILTSLILSLLNIIVLITN